MASLLQSTGVQSVGSVASVSKAFSSNVVAGSLISVSGVTSNADMPAGSVTDTQGNVYSQDRIQQRSANERTALFSTVASASGPLTVTVDCTGSDVQSIGISEFSPDSGFVWSTVAATRLETSNQGTGTSGASQATGNLVTSDTDVIVGVLTHGDVTETLNVGSGFAQLFEDEDATDMPINFEYRISAPGTYTANWTSGTSLTPGWCCVGAAYKQTAGPGPIAESVNVRRGVDRRRRLLAILD